MEFGIGLVGEHSSRRMVELSRRIESSGFDQIWVSDERFYRDVFVNMTLVACHTSRIRIGSMVTDPFVRHPALTAAAAASIDELSNGRCTIGMGAGISGFREMGIERVRPAKAIKEAVELIHRLTRGEKNVHFEGELVRFHEGHLNFPTRREVPIYVAGRGPKVLEAAGEVADGVVIGSFASEQGIRWGLERASHGAARAGRSLNEIDRVSWLYTAISEDGQRARDLVRKGVAVALWGSKEILPELGIEVPHELAELMRSRPYNYEVADHAATLIPDSLVSDFSVAGTADEVADKLIQIGRLGIRQAALWLFPRQGDDLEVLIESLADHVIPRVRKATADGG